LKLAALGAAAYGGLELRAGPCPGRAEEEYQAAVGAPRDAPAHLATHFLR
jgi:hypothetical protein